MARYKMRNWKAFFKNMEGSIKTFCRKWEGKTLPKWFFIYKQLEKCLHKNKYRRYLLARSNVPYFPVKKESMIMLKMTNLWSKKLAIFHNVKKRRFSFLIKHIYLIFVNKEILFQVCIEIQLKVVFIIFEGFFEWQK